MNSYNTILDADAYFAARYDYDLWPPLTDPVKTSLLVSAAQYLDTLCDWFGVPLSTDPNVQTLAFPRKGSTAAPTDIKIAELEIAYAMLRDGSFASSGLSSSGDPLTELKAGSVTLKFKPSESSSSSKGRPYINPVVASLLSKYGLCSFGCTTISPIFRQ